MKAETGSTVVDKSDLQSHLEKFGQIHLLDFWDSISNEQQRKLTEQIGSLDFELLQTLFTQQDTEQHWSTLAEKADVPPAITLNDFQEPESFAHAKQTGSEAIAAGKVAMILTAGGQGSRLGFEHSKGMYKIGPLSGRSLYQIILEKCLARARRFDSRIPMYIMTSPQTHEESTNFLQDNDWFGYAAEDVKLFCQGTMPAMDQDGKLILGEKHALFASPDGHGGMLAALEKSGCLSDLVARGIEHVFYGQVDNPLIQACDPALTGYHIQRDSELTTQVVRKNDPMQRVGNVVSVDGKVQIIEYSDLPKVHAEQRNADGSLKLWAGNIAVHIFKTEFLQRTSHQAGALPFHRANKKVPFVNRQGEFVQPVENNAIKFERFIFDLLPWANNAIVCEVDPAEGFCALKNAPPAPSETPAHVKSAISDLHKNWLQSAGAKVAAEAVIEINPLFALDAEELEEKIKPGTVIEGDRYFV